MEKSKLNFQTLKYIVLAFFIIMQVYLIFLKKHDALDLDIAPNTVPSPKILSGVTVGQTFIAKKNNLARIDVKMGTYDRVNDRDIIFELWAMNPKKKLAFKKTFNASGAVNNRYNTFKFKPIKDSEGREFYFLFYSPESTDENSISIWMNKANIYRQGSFHLNDILSKGDLVFRVYTKRPVFAELGRVVRNYSGLFASKTILIAVILFFEVVQIVFLSKLLDMTFRAFKGGMNVQGENGKIS
jgi:hypothetical protein